MTSETLFVFVVIGVASVLFASGRVRLDVVALLVVLALALSGILTVREALAGFGDPVVILVAGLLVMGEALTRSGVAYAIGAWMSKVGGDNEGRMIIVLMLVAAGLGTVMSSTAVVAILIPVVLNLAGKTGISASRLLMPLAFGALISGMTTLIATTPNLVVSAELGQAGFKPFNFFSFTPIGLSVLVVGVGYFLLGGRRLLPGKSAEPPKTAARTMRDLMEEYECFEQLRLLRVPPGSPLVGQSLRDAELGTRYDFRIDIIERSERFGRVVHPAPPPEAVIRAGDLLAAVADVDDVARLAEDAKLEQLPVAQHHRERWGRDAGLATVLVHPESRLIGKTLREAAFRTRYGIQVLAIRRGGEVLKAFLDHELESGDALLVVGSWQRLGRLQTNIHNFVVLVLPVEMDQVAPARKRAPAALAILAGMVVLSALEIVPVVVAVMMAALAMVFTRCLTMEDAYRSIHWSSVVLIAGMLPIADALVSTGGVDLIVDGLVYGLGDYGPYAMMAALFVLSAGLGLFLSNTATAVLLAPIAIRAAEALQVEPYAMAMTVAIAASAAFVTPVSTPVVTLVVEPGNYRFMDFVKVGLPMLVLTGVVTLLVTPLLFPF